MRDIKFRGKRDDTKEWVYGSLLSPVPSEYSMNNGEVAIGCRYIELGAPCYECANPFMDIYRVIHETVGQYIGQHDRNGKEIYEGDLVIIPAEDEQEAVKIEWDNDSSRFVFSARTYTCDFDSYGGEDCEVVGNIYDNFERDESVKQ